MDRRTITQGPENSVRSIGDDPGGDRCCLESGIAEIDGWNPALGREPEVCHAERGRAPDAKGAQPTTPALEGPGAERHTHGADQGAHGLDQPLVALAPG